MIKKVYATPNNTRMDKKSDEVVMTYPTIYFAIDDFNETWKEISMDKVYIQCYCFSYSNSKGT